MGRTKRKKGKKSRKRGGLSGFTGAVSKGKALNALKEAGLMLVAGIAGGGAGAAIGRNSLLLGIGTTIAGSYFDNKYIMAAGLGLAAVNVPATKSSGTSGVDGFDLKQIAQDAKDRVGQYFDTFKEKLYIPASDSATNGLHGRDEVKYFINPYSGNDLDLSAMDRVEEHVAAMNQGTAGLNDIDREF
jgi:hypothetical protein